MIKSLWNALLLLGLSLLTIQACGSSLWLSDNSTLYRIDPVSNIAKTVAGGLPIAALAITPSGAAWVLNGDRLLAFDAAGVIEEIDLQARDAKDAQLLAVDPFDGSLWVATANARLVHLDAHGNALGNLAIGERASALASPRTRRCGYLLARNSRTIPRMVRSCRAWT
jgi:hypothetical protein